MTTPGLQLDHYFGQAFVRDLIFELLFVSLRNLIILAVDATQVAVAEENISRAVLADQRRFLAEVSSVGGDDRQPPRIAGGNFILQPVVETVARTDCATFQ